jgi:hypothetical protein
MIHVRAASRSASWTSLAGGLGAVLLPKCPLCFAAYGSALGALGVSPAAHREIVDVLLILAVGASVGLVLALSRRRGDALTPLVSTVGAAGVLGGRLALDLPALTAAGALLLVGAALVNSVRCRRVVPCAVGGPPLEIPPGRST